MSSESLPLLLRQGSSEHSRFGSALLMQTSTAGSSFSVASEMARGVVGGVMVYYFAGYGGNNGKKREEGA